MAKNEVAVEQDYSYLIQKDEYEAIGVQPVGKSFERVVMGGTEDKVDETTGVEINAKRYNAPTFPGYNYDYLLVTPLAILPDRRQMYEKAYDGSKNAPICQSMNGIEPIEPGKMVLGTMVEACGPCPFAVYGSRPACMPRPMILGLALFYIGGTLHTYPVQLDIPVTSSKGVKDLILAMGRPVKLGDTAHILPHYKRVIKVGRASKQTQTGRTVSSWTFQLLGPTSNEVDPEEQKQAPNFAPPEVVQGIKELMEAAGSAIAYLSKPREVEKLIEGKKAPAQAGSIDAVYTLAPSSDDPMEDPPIEF